MIKLSQIVSSVQSELELPDSQTQRLGDIGIRGADKFHINYTGLPVAEELTVLGNKTAQLPCNFLTKISVYITNENGDKAPLTESAGISLGDDTKINRLSQKTTDLQVQPFDLLESSPITNLNYPFYFLEQLGMGAGSDLGFYRIDYKARLIVFDFCFPNSTVWLEFLPIAGTDDGDYLIHDAFREAMHEYIVWRHKKGNRKYSAGEVAQAKIDFDTELHNANKAVSGFDIEQATLQYNRTTRLARY